MEVAHAEHLDRSEAHLGVEEARRAYKSQEERGSQDMVLEDSLVVMEEVAEHCSVEEGSCIEVVLLDQQGPEADHGLRTTLGEVDHFEPVDHLVQELVAHWLHKEQKLGRRRPARRLDGTNTSG